MEKSSSSFEQAYKPLILPIPDEIPNLKLYLHADHIRISIVDSPRDEDPSQDPAAPPPTAALLVPRGRESDWIFSTEAGQIELLRGARGFRSLILIGNAPSAEEWCSYSRPKGLSEKFFQRSADCLWPFLVNFLPERNRLTDDLRIWFFRYDDRLVRAVALERLVGPIVGEMLIEDVEIEGDRQPWQQEFRRRLRFRQTPNLIQTEIKIVPHKATCFLSLQDMKFQLDLSALVHVYLAPMAAGLSLGSAHIQARLDSKIPLRALCLGIGGGSLPGFLATQLDFSVVGVEIDQTVWDCAKKYFGFDEYKRSVSVRVCDAVEFLESIKNSEENFDVIMLDLDPVEFSDMSKPSTLKFPHEQVFAAAKCCLCGAGLLVLNVIPPTWVDFVLLETRLRAEFAEIYKIDTGNKENFVYIATMAVVDQADGKPENAFMLKLKSKNLESS